MCIYTHGNPAKFGKYSCQIWKQSWGLQNVKPWWPLVHLGPFGWGLQGAIGPQSVTLQLKLCTFKVHFHIWKQPVTLLG